MSKIFVVILIVLALAGLVGSTAEAQLVGPLCIQTTPPVSTGSPIGAGQGLFKVVVGVATQGGQTVINGSGYLQLGIPVGVVPVTAAMDLQPRVNPTVLNVSLISGPVSLGVFGSTLSFVPPLFVGGFMGLQSLNGNGTCFSTMSPAPGGCSPIGSQLTLSLVACPPGF